MSAKRNLRVYERDHVYPQSISAYWDIFKLSPQKNPYIVNHWEVIFFGDNFFWARDTDFLEKAFRRWFNSWIQSASERSKIFNQYEIGQRRARQELAGLQKINVGALSAPQLARVKRRAMDCIFKVLRYSEYGVDLFDDYFAVIFKEWLAQKNIIIPAADFTDLICPATRSENMRYQFQILSLSLNKKISDKILAKLAAQYGWIKMSWDGSNELTAAEVKADIGREQKKSVVVRRTEIAKLKNYSKNILARRRALVRQYKITNTDAFFILLDKFNIFHDYRKEIQMRSNQIIYRVLREIPRRNPVQYDDLLWYHNPEVDSLLRSGKIVDKNVLANRKSGMLLHVQRGRIVKYHAQAAGAKAEELVWSVVRPKGNEEIKGLAASRGRVSGVAFVTKDAKVANRALKPGEILVTSMTTVDFVPAMKRSAAIVTSDGGATCHAAIIARELGIPCVVGTKVATEIIKSGDRIEVDANNGLVRVIK